jgi:hypothetical protein
MSTRTLLFGSFGAGAPVSLSGPARATSTAVLAAFPFPAQRFLQGPRIGYNVVFPLTALSQMVDVEKIDVFAKRLWRTVNDQAPERRVRRAIAATA